MSTSKLGLALKRFTTLALIWTVAALGAEGAFRLAGDRPSDDMGGLYTQFGKGYRQEPSVDTGANWSTGYFSVHTDDLGFRCDAIRRRGSKPGDTIDVLFMGDSQGFGNGVNYEETIPGTVARLAEERGYTVRNACIGGHHPPNQFALAKWLRDDAQMRVSTYVYLFTPVAIASCDSLTEAKVGDDGQLYNSTPDFKTRARMWVKTHSVVFSRVRDAIRGQGIGVKPDEESDLVFRLYSAGEVEQGRLNKCATFLRDFKEFAAKGGGTVQLVYVPLSLETNFTTVSSGAQRRGLSVDPDAPFRVLTAAAKEADLQVHDLRPVLRMLYSKGLPLSLFPDFHYTGAVSTAAGENVWQQISERLPKTNTASTYR